jgi:hypothetical protein
MTKTTGSARLRRAAIPLALFCFLASTALAQDAAARVDSIDAWLGGLRQAKRSIPQGTLQQWVTLQESLHDLALIESNPSTDSATAWRALYVAGYGFWTAELFDIAAGMAREVAEGTTDRTQRALALKDLAQSLENAGHFGESATESERLLAATDAPSLTEMNNHALRLLKAGRYEECLAAVNRIALSAEVAHTRIFSARALAYRGKFAEAAAELRLACDSGETAACTMLGRLSEETPEKYWRDDREYRERIWKPYNAIDSSTSLASSLGRDGSAIRAVASRFAPSFWFNEIHGLYPEPGENDVLARMPPGLPAGRFGGVVIDGVPFIAFLFDAGVADSTVRNGIGRYLASVHGASSWGPSMEERTRAQIARLDARSGGGTLVVITHAAWQEEWARRIAPKSTWSVVEKR